MLICYIIIYVIIICMICKLDEYNMNGWNKARIGKGSILMLPVPFSLLTSMCCAYARCYLWGKLLKCTQELSVLFLSLLVTHKLSSKYKVIFGRNWYMYTCVCIYTCKWMYKISEGTDTQPTENIDWLWDGELSGCGTRGGYFSVVYLSVLYEFKILFKQLQLFKQGFERGTYMMKMKEEKQKSHEKSHKWTSGYNPGFPRRWSKAIRRVFPVTSEKKHLPSLVFALLFKIDLLKWAFLSQLSEREYLEPEQRLQKFAVNHQQGLNNFCSCPGILIIF